MRAAFIHSPRLEEYKYPPDCPFRTERAAQLRSSLASMDLLTGEGRREVAPEPADRTTLLGFHAERYLDALEAAQGGHLDIEGLGMNLGTPDCPIFLGMYDHAALACGASVAGARLLAAGEVDVAFNPSGGFHHAHASRAGGFCYLNDVVLACQHLTKAGQRVLFLDIDVHHCDGVQDAFYDRRDVLTLSFHESPKTLYPGTGYEDEIGVGEGRGYSVNVPLPVGLYDELFLKAFRAVALPLIDAFRPDSVVVELGMDMLAADPLAHLSLSNNAHAEVVEILKRLGKPLLLVGGGGYNVKNTVRGWALAWSILCGAVEHDDDLSMGLGGIFLQTTDWRGGLRDRMLVPDARQRTELEPVVEATVSKIRAQVFPLHGL